MIHLTTTPENDNRNGARLRRFIDEAIIGGRLGLIDELWTTVLV